MFVVLKTISSVKLCSGSFYFFSRVANFRVAYCPPAIMLAYYVMVASVVSSDDVGDEVHCTVLAAMTYLAYVRLTA